MEAHLGAVGDPSGVCVTSHHFYVALSEIFTVLQLSPHPSSRMSPEAWRGGWPPGQKAGTQGSCCGLSFNFLVDAGAAQRCWPPPC